MFDRISRRYDFANHVLSAGLDYRWRKRATAIVIGWNPKRVLDVATGTGDLALLMQRRLVNAEVVGCDFSPEMLTVAATKGLRETIVADATDLPFHDRTFDVVTIAFGLRNISDRSAALREFSRVLRSSGFLLVLDFSMPGSGVRDFYRFYLHHLLPALAGMLTGARAAYEYLAESIEAFPSGEAMCAFVNANGFRGAAASRLTSGVVTIYIATRE